MNLITGKSNQYLREAILEGSLEKSRRYLNLKIGKADVGAQTDSGGFTMLHCAALVGHTQIVMMLLQYGSDYMALTDDGYTALDLAIWKGHLQVIELLRTQGCIAPMKEPESLNGKVILHLGKKATVVNFEPSTSLRSSSLRALYYTDDKVAKLVNLWAGTDYRIIGDDPYYEELKKYDFQYAEIEANTPGEMEDLLQGQAFVDLDDSDSDEDAELDHVVEITVPPGPLGVLLDSGESSCAVVIGFTPLPTGEKGVIEQHGGVESGMYIISVNNVNASIMTLADVTQLLGKLSRKEKVIKFARRSYVPKDNMDSDSDSDEEEGAQPPPAPIQKTSSRVSTTSSSGFSFAGITSSLMDRNKKGSKGSTTSFF